MTTDHDAAAPPTSMTSMGSTTSMRSMGSTTGTERHDRRAGVHVRIPRAVRWLLWLVALTIGAVALQGCVAPPPPCTDNWVGPPGGAFGTAANWDTNAVPTASRSACAPSGSSIVVDGSRSVLKITSTGSVRLPAGASLAIGTPQQSKVAVLDLAGGTLGGTGSMSTTNGTWTAGTISTGGTLFVTGGVTVSGDVAVANAVANAGTITVQGPSTLDIDRLASPTGTFVLGASGSTVRFAGGSAPIDLSGVSVQGGGTVANGVTGSPTLDPQRAVGPLNVGGNWTAAAGSSVKVSILNPSPAGHDEVHVAGVAEPSAATVDVTLDPGATLVTGDAVTLLSATSPITSSFGTANLPPIAGHGSYLTRTPAAVSLRVTDCDPTTLHPNAALTGANLAGRYLRGCDLTNSALTNANLTNVDFTDAILRTASMDGANVTGVVWSNTICPDGTNSDGNGGTCVGHFPLFLFANSHSDLVDTNPGDGKCLTATAGKCSIRAAIQEANAHPGRDVIDLQPASNAQLTITGVGENASATGDLDVTGDLLINGNGATLDANNIDKGIQVLNGAQVTADNFFVTKANGAGGAAAFDNVNGSLTLTNLSITSTNVGVLSAGTTTVRTSTISGASNAGVWTTAGSTTIAESTVSASGTSNGAIYNAGGATTVLDTTVTLSTGFGLRRTGGTMTVQNSIDANQAPGKFDCSGSITTLGYNLVSDGTCGFGAGGDTQAPDAKLNVLAVWGGIAKTHLPKQDSPAIDTGMPGCAAADQRGKPRATDGNNDTVGACDRGAVEAGAWHPMTITVNATADKVDANPGDGVCATSTVGECTIRAAVQESNVSAGPDIINLASGASYAQALTPQNEDAGAGGDLDLASQLTLHGNGSTIANSADGAFDVFAVGVTIDRLNFGGSGVSVLRNRGTLALDHIAVVGSGNYGISNTGQLSMVDSSLSASVVTGVANAGQFDATRVSLTSYESYVASAIGQATFHRATVSGLVHLYGAAATAQIFDSTIGNVNVESGSLTLTSSIVFRPTACTGTVLSGGYNIVVDATCNLGGTGDLQSTNPRLGPALLHGGTLTSMMPLTGSPAIDSGRPGCDVADQNGAVAPKDGNGDTVASCDRGAVEVATWNPLTLSVNTTADKVDAVPGDGVCQTVTVGQCSLRAAVQEASASTGPDVINLQPSATYALTVVGFDDEAVVGDLDVATELVVHGLGSTIDSSSLSSFDHTLQSFGAPMTLDHLTLVGSQAEALHSLGGPLSLDTVTTGMFSGGFVTASDSALSGSMAGGGAIVRSTLGANSTFYGPFDIDRSNFPDATMYVFGGGPSTIRGTTSFTASNNESFVVSGQLSIIDSTMVNTGQYGSPAIVNAIAGSSVTVTNSILVSAQVTPACKGAVSSGGYNIVSDASCGFTGPSDLQGTDPMLSPLAMHGGSLPTYAPLTGSPAIDSGRPGCSGTDARGQVRPTDGDGDTTAVCDRGALELSPWQPLNLIVNATNDDVDANPGNGVCATAASGQCTLRAAIQESDASTGPDTVTLVPGATYNLTRTGVEDAGVNGDLDVLSGLTLHGNGATINATLVDRAVEVFDTTVAMDSVTVVTAHAQLAAIVNEGTLDLTGLTMPNLPSTSQGGVLSWPSYGSPGTLHLTDSTVVGVGNTIEVDGTSTIDRVLFDNGARIVTGGTGTTVTVQSSTLVANSAGSFGLIVGYGGTINVLDTTAVGDVTVLPIRSTGAAITVTNSLLVNTTPSSGACTGPVSSGGYNMVSDASCGFAATGDLNSTNPLLGPLANYGGSSKVLQPRPGSPAIDSGRPGCPTTDQRGFPRPTDGDGNGTLVCDRGAAEIRSWNPLAITVSSTLDKVDANPGDGICATAAPVACTLRAAVQESNASTGPDVISLAPLSTYALSLAGANEDLAATGDLDVWGDLTVHGNGSVVDVQNLDRGFQDLGYSLALDNLVLTHATSAVDNQGGAVTLSGVTVTSSANLLTSTSGSVVVTDSSASALTGTGISSGGAATINRTTISGGSLCGAFGSNVTITASLFTGCTNGLAFGGPVTNVVTIANSTVSQTGTAANGYGINANANPITVVSSTFTGARGLEIVTTSSLSRVTNTIISNRVGFGPNCSGAVVSGGYNLVSDASCSMAATGDLQNTAANLGALASNGGPTQTHLPNAGSPAIDTGDPGCTGTDQRGVARPQGGGCDRGSVEQ
jgi:CSLREA domain-containing protein